MAQIYHLAQATDWYEAQDSVYTPASFASEGFIHCAYVDQLAGVAWRYFRDQDALMLLCIEVDALEAKLVAENTGGGVELFPHVYGPINSSAMVSATACSVNAAGELLPSL